MIKNKLETYVNKVDEFSIWSFDKILKGYIKKYFDINLNLRIKKKIFLFFLIVCALSADTSADSSYHFRM